MGDRLDGTRREVLGRWAMAGRLAAVLAAGGCAAPQTALRTPTLLASLSG